MPALEGYPEHGFYAVFDGHGGAYIAKQAAMQTVGFVMKTEDFKRDPLNPLSVGNAIRKGFLALDDEMRLLPTVRSGEDHSGCTAIGIMVTPTHFVVGNCGALRGQHTPPPPMRSEPCMQLSKGWCG
jgi:serine/threonine protein phosphatase PrpC